MNLLSRRMEGGKNISKESWRLMSDTDRTMGVRNHAHVAIPI